MDMRTNPSMPLGLVRSFAEDAEDIYRTSPCPQFSCSLNGVMLMVNPAFLQWSGYAEQEAIGELSLQDLLPPAERIYMQTHLRPLLIANRKVQAIAMRLKARNGTSREFLVNAVACADDGGEVQVLRFVLFDVEERLRYETEVLRARIRAEETSDKLSELSRRLTAANAALQEKTERLKVTLDAISEGVFSADMNGRITFINPVALALAGAVEKQALGELWDTVFELDNEEELSELTVQAREALHAGSRTSLRGRTMLRSSGRPLEVHYVATPMLDEHRQPMGMVVVLRDVSESVAMHRRIRDLSSRDALTGLDNRSEFERRVGVLLSQRDPYSVEHSLLYIDVDQFKLVNDSCGHAAGDQLLRMLTRLLREPLREGDLLGRLGGDEFGVLLPECRCEDAERIAERLLDAARELPFTWGDRVFPVSVSIGLVSFRSDGTPSVQDLFRMADSACFVAKDNGRNRYQLYALDEPDIERRRLELDWVGRIRQAVDSGRLTLYAQPIVPCAVKPDGRQHMEVLLRMRGGDGEIIAPQAFIPAAERYGLMPLLDRWVIATAFDHSRSIQETGGVPPVLAINLSGCTVCEPGFLHYVQRAFEQYGVDPANFCFEITETAAIANLEQARILVEALAQAGSLVALDDFGSGMSSFTYLKHLPVDYLKIDGSFVRNILTDAADRAIVACVHGVATRMGMQTVAEFVDSQDVFDALKEMGIDYAQGYAMARPEPLASSMAVCDARSNSCRLPFPDRSCMGKACAGDPPAENAPSPVAWTRSVP